MAKGKGQNQPEKPGGPRSKKAKAETGGKLNPAELAASLNEAGGNDENEVEKLQGKFKDLEEQTRKLEKTIEEQLDVFNDKLTLKYDELRSLGEVVPRPDLVEKVKQELETLYNDSIEKLNSVLDKIKGELDSLSQELSGLGSGESVVKELEQMVASLADKLVELEENITVNQAISLGMVDDFEKYLPGELAKQEAAPAAAEPEEQVPVPAAANNIAGDVPAAETSPASPPDIENSGAEAILDEPGIYALLDGQIEAIKQRPAPASPEELEKLKLEIKSLEKRINSIGSEKNKKDKNLPTTAKSPEIDQQAAQVYRTLKKGDIKGAENFKATYLAKLGELVEVLKAKEAAPAAPAEPEALTANPASPEQEAAAKEKIEQSFASFINGIKAVKADKAGELKSHFVFLKTDANGYLSWLAREQFKLNPTELELFNKRSDNYDQWLKKTLAEALEEQLEIINGGSEGEPANDPAEQALLEKKEAALDKFDQAYGKLLDALSVKESVLVLRSNLGDLHLDAEAYFDSQRRNSDFASDLSDEEWQLAKSKFALYGEHLAEVLEGRIEILTGDESPLPEPSAPPVAPEEEPAEPARARTEVAASPEERLKSGFAKLFISLEDLESINGFNGLSEGQKLLVMQQLMQMTLDKAQTESLRGVRGQRENFQKRKVGGFFDFWNDGINKANSLRIGAKNIWQGITRKYRAAKFEHKAVWQLKGIEAHRQNLEWLVSVMSYSPEVRQGEHGEVRINYASGFEGLSEEEQKQVDEFNQVAEKFGTLAQENLYLYESQRKQKKFNKNYEALEGQYNAALGEIFELALKNKFNGNRAAAMIYINNLEAGIKVNQFLNANPEAEQRLDDIAGQSTIKRSVYNICKERGYYMGAGFVTRAAATTALGFAGLPLAGVLLGGQMARSRGKTDIKERAALSRRGEAEQLVYVDSQGEKMVREKRNFIKAEELIGRINVLLGKIEQGHNARFKKEEIRDSEGNVVRSGSEKRYQVTGEIASSPEELKAMDTKHLARLCEYVTEKLRDGLVNFGKSDEAFKNQYELIKKISEAKVALELQRSDYDSAADIRLHHVLNERKVNIEKEKVQELRRKMLIGAGLGATFALAGAMIKDFGAEHGWWGNKQANDPENIKNWQKSAEKLKHNPENKVTMRTSDGQSVRAEQTEQAMRSWLKSVETKVPGDPNSAAPAEAVKDQSAGAEGAPAAKGAASAKPEAPAQPPVDKETAAAAAKAAETGADNFKNSAIVTKGDGVTKILRRQMIENPKNFGYDGKMDDEAIRQWANDKAYGIAKNNGYIDLKTGQEVRIATSGIGRAAYELKYVNGQYEVHEHFKAGAKGAFSETEVNRRGAVFEGDKHESYEYLYDRPRITADADQTAAETGDDAAAKPAGEMAVEQGWQRSTSGYYEKSAGFSNAFDNKYGITKAYVDYDGDHRVDAIVLRHNGQTISNDGNDWPSDEAELEKALAEYTESHKSLFESSTKEAAPAEPVSAEPAKPLSADDKLVKDLNSGLDKSGDIKFTAEDYKTATIDTSDGIDALDQAKLEFWSKHIHELSSPAKAGEYFGKIESARAMNFFNEINEFNIQSEAQLEAFLKNYNQMPKYFTTSTNTAAKQIEYLKVFHGTHEQAAISFKNILGSAGSNKGFVEFRPDGASVLKDFVPPDGRERFELIIKNGKIGVCGPEVAQIRPSEGIDSRGEPIGEISDEGLKKINSWMKNFKSEDILQRIL